MLQADQPLPESNLPSHPSQMMPEAGKRKKEGSDSRLPEQKHTGVSTTAERALEPVDPPTEGKSTIQIAGR